MLCDAPARANQWDLSPARIPEATAGSADDRRSRLYRHRRPPVVPRPLCCPCPCWVRARSCRVEVPPPPQARTPGWIAACAGLYFNVLEDSVRHERRTRQGRRLEAGDVLWLEEPGGSCCGYGELFSYTTFLLKPGSEERGPSACISPPMAYCGVRQPAVTRLHYGISIMLQRTSRSRYQQ